MSIFHLQRQFKRMLTFLPRKAYLPYIRKTLRMDYNAADLTPQEALLIAANLAYDKHAAARLLRESGKSASQLVEENPRRKPRPKKMKRLLAWLRRMEGSESLAAVTAQIQAPEYRQNVYEEE